MSNTKKCLLSKETIADSIRKAGAFLSEKYAGEHLHFVVVMKGAIFFAADLMREITLPCTFSYIQCKSYTGTEQKEVEIIYLEKVDFSGKIVLILDDIHDTGHTLKVVSERLRQENPRILESMVLIEKNKKRESVFSVEYALNKVEDHFLIGYGLDMHEYERNIPDICIYGDS